MKLKAFFPYFILILAGGLSVFAFAPFNKPLFIIVSLFGLIWVSNSFISKKQVIIGVLIYGLAFFWSQLYWMFYSLYSVINIGFINSALGIMLFCLYLSVYLVLSILMFRRFKTSSDEFNYLFLLPSCWVLGEWLRGWVFTGFSWCDIAYTQVNNYLMQGFFPVLGSYGVSWLAMSVVGFLFLVLINNRILVSNKPNITLQNRLAIIYFVILAIVGYGIHGISYTSSYGKPTSIALVQGNINGAEKWNENKFLDHLNHYTSLIKQSKADLVVLPETAIPTYIKYLPEHYIEDVSNIARKNGAELIIGMPREINNRGDYVNAAVVITESGFPYYAKNHLVPYGEYIPLKNIWGKFYLFAGIPMVGFSSGGDNQKPMSLANQKIAFNICYENGFGSELIKAASNSTVMLNLSDMVWYGDSIAEDQHLQLSQARAMENQRYFLQDTNSGLTAVIDHFGHVEATLPSFTSNILTTYVQGRVGITPYQRYGNYPIVIFSGLILLLALFLRKKF
ncbi:MAG: apolipoprotein N-acyltransferase [Burkholderiales bacterium]|nr:apolipoprotein N-acyltransferase [Burkholderiales bacterium]